MTRKIAILLMVFAGFYMAGHYWIRWRNRVSDDVVKTARLMECDAGRAQRLRIVQTRAGKKEELVFERVDVRQEGLPVTAQLAASEWKFSSGGSGEADATMLNRISSMLCQLYDPIPVRAQEANQSEERRATVLNLETSDKGETNNFELKFLADTQDRMSLVEYEGKTYKIPRDLFQTASHEPNDYANYRVVRMTPDTIHAASFIIDGKERFTIEREGSDWRVLAAGKELGKGSEEAGRFVNRIATLRAMAVARPEFPAGECERGTHKVRVELSGLSNKRETVYFAASAGQRDRLSACSTARSTQFLVHSDLMKYLSQPAKKLTMSR